MVCRADRKDGVIIARVAAGTTQPHSNRAFDYEALPVIADGFGAFHL